MTSDTLGIPTGIHYNIHTYNTSQKAGNGNKIFIIKGMSVDRNSFLKKTKQKKNQ